MRCDESTKELGTAEEMDTSVCHSADHWQTVPASSSSSAIGAGHKRRLLQKSRQDPALDDEPRTPLAPENYKPSFENARSFGVTSVSIESSSQQEGGRGKKLSGEELSRQPTIEEPPPSPTLVELFRTNDVIFCDNVCSYFFPL